MLSLALGLKQRHLHASNYRVSLIYLHSFFIAWLKLEFKLKKISFKLREHLYQTYQRYMHIYASKERGIRIIPFLIIRIVLKVIFGLITCIREGIVIIFIITTVIRRHFYNIYYIYSVFFDPYNLLNFIEFYSICQC